MSGETIEEIVDRVKEGDEVATEKLYHMYSHRIYSLCLRMVRNQADAEDLTQEVFLQAFRKIHTFRGDAAFSTWLYRLGVNTVLMYLRRTKRPEVSLDALTWSNGEETKRLDFADRKDHAGTLMKLLLLRRALELLPSGFRRAIVLHDFEGYEHREIAETTKRSIGNSKSQLHKARRRLATLLTQDPGARSPEIWVRNRIG